ncbi:acyltransferase [Escherichia fergusonii]|uniref:acyltransferase n=1 Tax=Escherichia fergusonii TaxID=564 RepID=UPI0015E58961|nr:acyltransferase family protein [Escherichia fergusonii]QLN37212.1 acyltransferase family protein [Escherichia fergusonii]QMH67744.1 acyltransferase family protein [Escherichia fergusonii]
MVVLLHVCALFESRFGTIPLSDWIAVTIGNSFTRASVPMFFMVSGFLFLSVTEVKLKNIFRLITSLIFYSVIYSVYVHYKYDKPLFESLTSIYREPVFYHLWFFYYLIICYALMFFVKSKSSYEAKHLIVISFIFTFLSVKMNDLTRMFGFHYQSISLINSGMLLFIFYCVAGAVIASIEYKKSYYYISIITVLLSVSILTILTYYASLEKGKYNSIFEVEASIPVYYCSVSMFYILRHTEFKGVSQRIIEVLSSSSLVMYGLHVLFVDSYKFERLKMNPIKDMITTTASVIVACVILAFLIKKIDRRGYVS